MIDLPIIQLTATGLSMNGQQEDDPEELAAADVGVEEQGEPEGDHVLDENGEHVIDHVEHGVPEEGIAEQGADVVQPAELAARRRS